MAEIYIRSGSSVYQARIRVGDAVKRVSTGRKTPGEAQQEADRIEAEQQASLVRAGDIQLVAGAERFFKEKKTLAPKTVEEYERSLGNILLVLGNFPLRLLTNKEVRHYINQKLETTGSVQIRRDLAFLSSLLTKARDWDCGIEHNVVKDYDKRGLADANERTTWLRPKDVDALMKACTKDAHRHFILMAVHTGMRHQELLQLHWDEIDLDERIITLGGDRTKNSCPREIPMSQDVFDTLSSTPLTHRRGHYFKGKDKANPQVHMGARFRTIRKRAGLPEIHIHDLRHTFASWAKQRGVPETTIMTLLGHKTRHMVKRYSHDSHESLRAAIATMSRNTLSSTPRTDK